MFLKLRSSALAGTALATILIGLSGCDSSPRPITPITDLPTKPEAEAARDTTAALIAGTPKERRTEPTIVPGPAPPASEFTSTGQTTPKPSVSGQVASVSIEQMPIPTFINTILGETLHLTFEIDPKVTAMNELVTLRTGGPKSAQELLTITEEVLKNYGIQLSFEHDVVRVRPSEALKGEMPQIIIGRGTPDIAASMRPIFQVLALNQVNNQDMASWLSTTFGPKVKFIPSPSNNSIILLGLPDDVRAATEGIRLLDQPRLAGHKSMRVAPVYWSVTTMAEKLGDVLRTEGYNVSSTPVPPAAVTLLPLPTANVLLVFTSTQQVLDHVAKWVRDLDQPAQVDPRQSVFYYPVKNTTADSLVKVLNAVLGDSTAATSAELEQPALLGRQQAQPAAAAAKPGSATHFVTDTTRNALIFLGSAEAYSQVLPLMESLDQPQREVLIEITVAQVTLNDSESLGLEWSNLSKIGGGNTLNVTGGGGGGGGSSSSSTSSSTSTSTTGTAGAAGLFLQVLNGRNPVGETLAALAATGRTKIITTPKLLARSGATAKFQVGTDVPIVTAQVTSSSFVSAGLQQSVSYRSTGTLIQVKPVVYAGNQIDLDISQEQSDVNTSTSAGVGGSPPIDDQNVSTQLSLADGATVLLGGFIKEQKTDGSSGLPYLKDIPGVGALFRSNSASTQRTETLIFITPYIVNSGEDSKKITDSVREHMQQWPQLHDHVIY